jgi:hypothetical protein
MPQFSTKRVQSGSAVAYRRKTYLQAAYLALVPVIAGIGYLILICGGSGTACPSLLLTLGAVVAPASILSLGLSSPYLIPLGAVTLATGLKLASTAEAVGDRPSARRLRWHLLIPLTTIAVSVSSLAVLFVSAVAVLLLVPGFLAWV